MKRTITYVVVLVIFAITAQVIWNTMISPKDRTSEKNILEKIVDEYGSFFYKDTDTKVDESWKKDVADIPMEDLLADGKAENKIDVEQAIDQMLDQPKKVYLPKIDNLKDIYSLSSTYFPNRNNVMLDLSYRSSMTDGSLIFFHVEDFDENYGDYITEKLKKPDSFEYEGFSGLVGVRKDAKDTTVIFTEKEGYHYNYTTYVEMDKEKREKLYKNELDLLTEDDTIWETYLQIDTDDLGQIIYPYFKEEVDNMYATLEYRESAGPTLRIQYAPTRLKVFLYTIYFDPKEDKFPEDNFPEDRYTFDLLTTESGVDVKRYQNKGESKTNHFIWEMNGMYFEVNYDRNSEDMNEHEVLILIDTIMKQYDLSS